MRNGPFHVENDMLVQLVKCPEVHWDFLFSSFCSVSWCAEWIVWIEMLCTIAMYLSVRCISQLV